MRTAYRFLLCLIAVVSIASVTAQAGENTKLREHFGWHQSVNGGVWYQSDEDASYWGYYQNGRQVAGYDADFDEYRLYDRKADQWGSPKEPPWGYRVRRPAKETGNFGNDYQAQPGQSDSPKPKYRINGKPSSKADVISTIRASATPKLPDDGNRLRVVTIGSGNDRKVVDRDMATSPALQNAKGTVVYKSYDPGEWEAVDFKATGHPTVSIVDPKTRRELHRQEEYDGPDSLAYAIEQAEASRAADPNYNPAKSPDLRSGLNLFGDPAVSSALMVALMFGLGHLAIRSKL